MAEQLSEQEGSWLLKLARKNILDRFEKENKIPGSLETEVSSLVFEKYRGTFVTLHKKGDLRGCIGNIDPIKTILQGVMDNAGNAAFNDSRFNPLSFEELKDTIIEISILTPPKNLDYKDSKDLTAKLRPHIDGVIIKKQYKSATFLPQVWGQLNDPETFLTQLCYKAGLSGEEWRSGDLNVLVYQVQSFQEKS
ncbi:MAG: AmmeMemoRadiSam system protein A [Desulfobacula sp.]|jgi:AmmeMemoRadiSam system protein A|uniref:AmmeMemoRadiSam system protein A n=1 Tax=Desulfobacula sp. TaxID=2593537 RepID=UPI001DE8D339|nr:AmmeMemoRadiSam system protein A [Desulfobacula sp.]MBT3484153.1 AmmeMemoRadiSam system protein A [Desulfobacula sp.]MBT3803734.1 AmmeMemoRadiSam system protein A [Desulfobacula sp.]MBT4024439.1 AmmeMemoRadiSam system protein A [Desulfobacula sp.]MBT4198480.1 AmmeMemoRadiSam system protein A [Desulfobacula sp.]